jgi:multidrug resistance efflux pump
VITLSKKIKTLIGAAILIIAASAVFVTLKPVEAETYTIEPKTAELYFTEVGEAVADRNVSVYSFVSGKLLSADVKKGQRVKKGDVICQVDPSDYLNSIAQLESGIMGYLAETKTGSSVQSLSVAQYERNAQKEKENLDGLAALYDDGAVSKNELDAARLRYESALMELRQSREQLALINNGGGDGANAQVSRLQIDRLKQNVEDCVIRAPISGIITSFPAGDTNLITNQMLVAVVESEEDIKIEVSVNTSDIDNIHVGDIVELSLVRRGGDKITCGKVAEIDQNAEIKITAKGN